MIGQIYYSPWIRVDKTARRSKRLKGTGVIVVDMAGTSLFREEWVVPTCDSTSLFIPEACRDTMPKGVGLKGNWRVFGAEKTLTLQH